MTETKDMWVTSFRPNGLQAAADGLWVIAQSNGGETDQHIYKLRYEDGALVSKVHTDAVHASGVTEGGGHLWATGGYDLLRLNYDGSTSETFLAPGGQGAHGVEWVDDRNMWVIDPVAYKAHLVDPGNMELKRSITLPGPLTPHGVFYHDDALWLGATERDGGGTIYKLEPHTGEVLHQIQVDEPEVHGMTLRGGSIWFCCAVSYRVCTVPLPV